MRKVGWRLFGHSAMRCAAGFCQKGGEAALSAFRFAAFAFSALRRRGAAWTNGAAAALTSAEGEAVRKSYSDADDRLDGHSEGVLVGTSSDAAACSAGEPISRCASLLGRLLGCRTDPTPESKSKAIVVLLPDVGDHYLFASVFFGRWLTAADRLTAATGVDDSFVVGNPCPTARPESRYPDVRLCSAACSAVELTRRRRARARPSWCFCPTSATITSLPPLFSGGGLRPPTEKVSGFPLAEKQSPAAACFPWLAVGLFGALRLLITNPP